MFQITLKYLSLKVGIIVSLEEIKIHHNDSRKCTCSSTIVLLKTIIINEMIFVDTQEIHSSIKQFHWLTFEACLMVTHNKKVKGKYNRPSQVAKRVKSIDTSRHNGNSERGSRFETSQHPKCNNQLA